MHSKPRPLSCCLFIPGCVCAPTDLPLTSVVLQGLAFGFVLLRVESLAEEGKVRRGWGGRLWELAQETTGQAGSRRHASERRRCAVMAAAAGSARLTCVALCSPCPAADLSWPASGGSCRRPAWTLYFFRSSPPRTPRTAHHLVSRKRIYSYDRHLPRVTLRIVSGGRRSSSGGAVSARGGGGGVQSSSMGSRGVEQGWSATEHWWQPENRGDAAETIVQSASRLEAGGEEGCHERRQPVARRTQLICCRLRRQGGQRVGWDA